MKIIEYNTFSTGSGAKLKLLNTIFFHYIIVYLNKKDTAPGLIFILYHKRILYLSPREINHVIYRQNKHFNEHIDNIETLWSA